MAGPWRQSLTPAAITGAATGSFALAMASGLLAWSVWWPHADNRQLLAYTASVLLAIVASVALSVTARLAPRESLAALTALVVGAIVLGATAGLVILQSVTAGPCGPGCDPILDF